MRFPHETLDAAHRHSANQKAELERSDVCSFLFCEKAFTISDVEERVEDESGTALCPHCGNRLCVRLPGHSYAAHSRGA